MFQFANIFSKVISIVVGLLFLVIGSLFFFKYDPAAYDRQTTGVIAEIDEHYEWVGDDNQLMHDVYIDYTVDGQKYEHAAYFEYNSKMKVGDKVEFYYMSEDPTQIAGSDKEMTPYFGLAAAVLGAAMVVFCIVRIIRKKPM